MAFGLDNYPIPGSTFVYFHISCSCSDGCMCTLSSLPGIWCSSTKRGQNLNQQHDSGPWLQTEPRARPSETLRIRLLASGLLLILSEPLWASVSSVMEGGEPFLVWPISQHCAEIKQDHICEGIFLQRVVLAEGWVAGKGQTRQAARLQNQAGPPEWARSQLCQELKQIQTPSFSSCCPLCLECLSTFSKLLLIFKNPIQTMLLFVSVFRINHSVFTAPLASHTSNSTSHSVE